MENKTTNKYPMSIAYYDPNKVRKWLDMINAINEKAEEKIERIRKRRDEQVSIFDRQIIEEKAKPQMDL